MLPGTLCSPVSKHSTEFGAAHSFHPPAVQVITENDNLLVLSAGVGFLWVLVFSFAQLLLGIFAVK